MGTKKKIKYQLTDRSEDGCVENSKLSDFSGILVSVLTVFLVLFLMDRNTFVKFPLVFGDAGFTDLNYSLSYVFSGVNPWFNTLYIVSFHSLRSEFGIIYNETGMIPVLLMPVSMYFLLKKLGMGLTGRIAGSVLYVINPTVLVWGGIEYGGPLLFLPIITRYVILYYERNRLIYLLYSGIFILLFETFIGFPDIKLLIPFLAIFVSMLFFKALREKRLRVLSDLLIWILFTAVISIPFFINIGGSYEIYNTAFSSSNNLYNIEIGIVRYVFQSSNLQNSLMGLTVYPVTYVLASGFTKSWSELVWFLIVVSSIFTVFFYQGRYRLFYALLIILLGFMVIFQYGVYNGTFLWMYHYSFVVIYNYPLFFDEMQMFIYAIFFAWFVHLLIIKSGSIKACKRPKLHLLAIHRKKIVTVIALSAILVATLPLIHYSNGDGTIESNPSKYETPSYLYSIISDLAPYQGYKALVLPNNDTTLTYLDAAMPYLNVYGLPYNFQAFPTEFPNVTIFGELGKSFADGNTQIVSRMLGNQDLGLIVVLNANENSTITSSSTTISGGGKNFASIINSTGVYRILDETPQFIIYKYADNASINKTIPPSPNNITNSLDRTNVWMIMYNALMLPVAVLFFANKNIEDLFIRLRWVLKSKK